MRKAKTKAEREFWRLVIEFNTGGEKAKAVKALRAFAERNPRSPLAIRARSVAMDGMRMLGRTESAMKLSEAILSDLLSADAKQDEGLIRAYAPYVLGKRIEMLIASGVDAKDIPEIDKLMRKFPKSAQASWLPRSFRHGYMTRLPQREAEVAATEATMSLLRQYPGAPAEGRYASAVAEWRCTRYLMAPGNHRRFYSWAEDWLARYGASLNPAVKTALMTNISRAKRLEASDLLPKLDIAPLEKDLFQGAEAPAATRQPSSAPSQAVEENRSGVEVKPSALVWHACLLLLACCAGGLACLTWMRRRRAERHPYSD